jgi:glyoxylase-like metal-dependent hydrolase (beta-lactamase superfamily II)
VSYVKIAISRIKGYIISCEKGYCMRSKKITGEVYQVGGATISDSRDCAVYLLDLGELVLIDSGLGGGFDRMIRNIESIGFDPARISTVIITHCHVDHVGGAALFQERFGSRLVMHDEDAKIVGRGDQTLTAAFCFNIDFQPLRVDVVLRDEEENLTFGDRKVVCLHTPGHTPGSLSAYFDMDGLRILFAQDIGAALLKEFNCDPVAWMKSVKKLLALDADILCDGHSGAYGPKKVVEQYLQCCIDSQRQGGYLEGVL